MNRQLLCRGCGDGFHLVPEDKALGWRLRLVYVAITAPDLHCDGCNDDLTHGVAVAVTQWQLKQLGVRNEPPNWEQDYGTVITKEVADTAAKLSDEPKPVFNRKPY